MKEWSAWLLRWMERCEADTYRPGQDYCVGPRQWVREAEGTRRVCRQSTSLGEQPRHVVELDEAKASARLEEVAGLARRVR